MSNELQHALNVVPARPVGHGGWALAAIALAFGMLGSAGCQSQTGAKVPVADASRLPQVMPTPPKLDLGVRVAERSAEVKEERAQRAGDTQQKVLPPGLPGTEIAVRQQINGLIGKAACDAPTQCKTLGLGSTPCGGPEAWVAWSSKDPVTAKLPALGEQFAKLQRSRHEVSGMRSICRYLPDPGATCAAGQCVLKTANTTS